jgi:hypothetical protein
VNDEELEKLLQGNVKIETTLGITVDCPIQSISEMSLWQGSYRQFEIHCLTIQKPGSDSVLVLQEEDIVTIEIDSDEYNIIDVIHHC